MVGYSKSWTYYLLSGQVDTFTDSKKSGVPFILIFGNEKEHKAEQNGKDEMWDSKLLKGLTERHSYKGKSLDCLNTANQSSWKRIKITTEKSK